MNDDPKKSRVLTLVFTDLVSSTALKTEKGDDAVGELIARHRQHVTRLAEESSGRVIDWAGDGCFLTFETSSAAVMFALRLQQAHAEEADLPGVRIGVHMGEVTERPGPGEAPRIEGLAVDIAARVGSLAKPGQVLMSSAVYNSARQRLGVDTFGQPILWQAHGTYSLKGFDQPVDIGEAGLEGLSPLEAPTAGDKAHLIKRAPKSARTNAAAPRGRPSGLPKFAALASLIVVTLALGLWLGREFGEAPEIAPPPPADPRARITSLAVLPLDNLMNDPEQDYFVDGMTEAITAELSKISSLKVISRTSTARYKETELSMPEIAAELDVEGLIEGSVLRDGNQVRITVQLIHGPADQHLWTATYDNTLENVLQIHSDVALAIAGEIQATVTPDERERVAEASIVNSEVLEAYFRGRVLLQSRSKRDMERAAEEFQRAIDIDETFAPAHAGLGDAYNMLAAYNYVQQSEVYETTKNAALRAIELDAFLAEAYATLGWTLVRNEADWEGSRRAFEKALSLDPNYATGHLWYGHYLMWMGRNSEARREFTKAIELDPHALKPRESLAMLSWFEGDDDEAIRRELKILEDDPNFLPAVENLIHMYISSGQLDRALERAERYMSLRNRDSASLVATAMVLVEMGRRDEAETLLDGVPIDESGWGPQYYAALGETERALDLVRDYASQKNYWPGLTVLPSLDALREDDRFWQLLEELGYPKMPPGHPVYNQQQAYFARKAAAEEGRVPIERVAVLPFANISGDAEQEWFVDGMTEALTMELAKIKALTVVSRTSSMQYKGVIRPMQEIARELGVDALIEGSVFRVGDKVRITAQLIDGRTDKHLWADRYDGTLDDILNLQSEVALAIAGEIDVVLTPEEETRLTTARSIDPEAHEAYFRGRHLWNKRTEADMLRAIQYFEEAVDHDPEFALAHAAIADAYNLLGIYTYAPPQEAFEKAIESARRALEIDDTLAAAHTSLAYALALGNFDLTGGIREYERALELDPKSVQAYSWYSATEALLNRPEKAMELADRAVALDPVSPLANSMRVIALLFLDRNEEAIELGRNVREIHPDYVLVLMWLGHTLIEASLYEEAIVTYEHLAELSGRHETWLAYLGLVYAKTGRRDDALAILVELDEKVVSESTAAYNRALVHFGLGEIDETLTLLEKSTGERHRGLLELNSTRLWDPLRDDPRFEAIIEKLNFPE